MRRQSLAFLLEKFDERCSSAKGARCVKSSLAAGLLSAVAVLAACGGSAGDQGDHPGDPHSPTAEAGKVKGVAVDTQNRPLSGAKIDVCSSVFYNSCVDGTTGSDGSYSLTLTPTNVWRAYGSITRSYDGKTFCLPLAIDNDNSFASADATIRNFSWKLSGLIPGRNADGYPGSYFGGQLNVVFSSGDRNRVRLNFVPNGPLIDGSAGSAFSAVASEWATNTIGNIPLGVYTVTAEYVPPSGAPIPLRITTDNFFGTYGPSATVHFTPDSSCMLGPEASVYLQP